MSKHLPVHPTLLHPLTGQPLRAIGFRPSGAPLWPIMGGDGTGGDANDKSSGDGGATGQDADQGKPAGDKTSETGFPPNTPVADMTLEQQVAYHKHQSRKHEARSQEWKQIAGDKTPEQIKADLAAAEKIRQESMTDAQRQVEEAKNNARTETAKTVGASAARVLLEFALGHDAEKNDQSALIETLDMSKLVNEDGSVATDKVRALVAHIAPSDKDQGNQRHDFGGGNRNTRTGPKSIAQVMAERAEARAAKQK